MSFIQNLFTSRDNNANGNSYVGQEDRIWWNPDTNAFYYSDGNTAGGILITGGTSGNGLPGGIANTVQYNAGSSNFGGDPNFTFDSSTSTLTITNIVANTLTGGAGGTNTQVQFNTNGNFTGNSNFTYNSTTSALLVAGTATLGNVFPASNNVSNIGSATNRFNDLWLGSGNINLIDDTLNINQEINAVNGNLVISGGQGLVFGQFAIYGNTISTINPTANINIGLVGSTGYVDIERPIAVNSTGGGAPAFVVEQDGTVGVFNSNSAANTPGALNIVGSLDRAYQNVTNSGGMIHITGPDNSAARITVDAYGAQGGVGSPGVLVFRSARGNATTPTATQANDTLARISAVGWGNTFGAGATLAATAVEFVALETFTPTSQGTKITFNTADIGSNSRSVSATIQSNGISLLNNTTANSGITFKDGSFQNTAYLSTSVVRSLTAGAGIALSASTGNITIQSTGVLGIVGTANQISITGNVGNVVTLGTPQDLAPTSNVQFNNLTVNNLSILGNISNVLPSIIDGPVIYVANTATTYNDINNSGLSTGNIANNYYASILYQTSSNTWKMDIGNSTGVTTGNVYAENVIANALIQAGNVFATPIFAPTLVFRGDLSLDDVIGVGIQNHFQGANASTAFIAAPNNGVGPSSNYIITGINSNVYANSQYAVAGANDGYVRVNGGNLIIGTETPTKSITFFTGGVDSATAYDRVTITDTGLSAVGNITANNMISINATIGGTVSAAGNVTGGNLLAPAGIVSASGNITGLNVNAIIVSATGNIRGANINTNGLISTLGNVQAGNINTTGAISSTGNIITANIAAGNITSAIISATGNITGPNIVATILTVSSLMSVTGNIQGGNFLTDGLISTTGNVTSNYFIGNGSQLTGIAVSRIANGTSNVSIATASGNATIGITGTPNVAVFSTTGQYVTGLISSTGNVIGGNLVGQNLTPTRVTFVGSGKEIDDDAEFTYNDTTNTLSVGNISASGNVNAAYFNGNGSGLTGTVGGSRYFGSFLSTTTQTNTSPGNALPMTFDTADAWNLGVQLGSPTPNSHIIINNPGVYNIQFSAQLDKTDAGVDTVDIWLSQDGVNVPNTNTTVTLSGNNDKAVAAWNFLVQTTTANSYFQLYWTSIDADLRIFAQGTQINPTRPAIPSIILTVTQA